MSGKFWIIFLILFSVAMLFPSFVKGTGGTRADLGASGVFEPVAIRQSQPASALVPISLFDFLSGNERAQTLGIDSRSLEPDHSLFEPIPPGWNLDTIGSIYRTILSLPKRVPELIQYVTEEGRMFGAMGSIFLIVFVVTVFYSVIWRKRVFRKLEKELQPLWDRVPEQTSPYLLSFIRILVSPLLPLLFLGVFLLIQGFFHYDIRWFTLVKKLLALWVGGMMAVSFLREFLTDGLLPFCPLSGKVLFRDLSLVLIYIVAGVAVVWVVEAIQPPDDVQAFTRFAVSLTAVCVISSLFLKKEALLSLLPRLPYRSYSAFARFIERAYFPLALLAFLTGLLWCLGYRRLSEAILIKTWGVGGAYVATMLSYYFLSDNLGKWSEKKDLQGDEAAQFFFRSAKAVLQYGTIAISTLIILDMLGLLVPLHDMLAKPVITISDMPVSFLVLIEAGTILFGFIYARKLLQAYLDYKVYPSMGIDTGLAYALDTFLKYLFIAIGSLSALRVIGLDLRVLMVFAGGLGIGAGFGLQHIAGNVVSGFILVFGRKLRKGDWIKVGDKLGMVTHIYLRATKIWTRDNIEFIVPNNDLTTKAIINYTLTSPIVRIYIPVAVANDSDPIKVRKILVECAEKHQTVTQFRKPEARISEFGDSSIVFMLLVWIDISRVAERDIKSRLYFTIFEALGDAGIALPNPQRDINIRSIPARQVASFMGKEDSDSRQEFHEH